MYEKEPVEKYKLSKEQVMWTKAYSKQKKMQAMLQSELMKRMSGANQVRSMLQSVSGNMQKLVKGLPSMEREDLQGQRVN